MVLGTTADAEQAFWLAYILKQMLMTWPASPAAYAICPGGHATEVTRSTSSFERVRQPGLTSSLAMSLAADFKDMGQQQHLAHIAQAVADLHFPRPLVQQQAEHTLIGRIVQQSGLAVSSCYITSAFTFPCCSSI